MGSNQLLNKARITEDAYQYNIHSDDGLSIGGNDINTTSNKKNKISSKLKTKNIKDITNKQISETVFYLDNNKDTHIRLRQNQDFFELNKNVIPHLKQGKSVSFAIKQQKIESNGRIKSIGNLTSIDMLSFLNQNNLTYYPNKDINLSGNIITYITFKPIKTKPLTTTIEINQVEYPGKGTLINKGSVFTKKLEEKEIKNIKIN